MPAASVAPLRSAAAAVLAAVCLPCVAAEVVAWPPPEPVASRIRALQQAIVARESTPAQRDAARAELADLLKSPAGRSERTPQEAKAPARAAIEPFPSVVRPANVAPPAPPPPAAGVARVEVLDPPKPVVNPRTGSAATPMPGQFAVDPRTGTLLHPAPGGHVDPRTGQFIPR